jgi:hypothetical protein
MGLFQRIQVVYIPAATTTAARKRVPGAKIAVFKGGICGSFPGKYWQDYFFVRER